MKSACLIFWDTASQTLVKVEKHTSEKFVENRRPSYAGTPRRERRQKFIVRPARKAGMQPFPMTSEKLPVLSGAQLNTQVSMEPIALLH